MAAAVPEAKPAPQPLAKAVAAADADLESSAVESDLKTASSYGVGYYGGLGGLGGGYYGGYGHGGYGHAYRSYYPSYAYSSYHYPSYYGYGYGEFKSMETELVLIVRNGFGFCAGYPYHSGGLYGGGLYGHY